MKKIFIRGLITSLSLVSLAACQDYDGGFNSSEIKKAEYAKDFEKTFGKVDPNQDWNMAQNINASINVRDARGSVTVGVFEVDPLANVNAKALSLIDIIDGKATWKFDAPKSDKELFVQVMQNGYRLYAGFCTIENGNLAITDNAFHKPVSASTRAMGTGVGDLLWTEMIWDGEELSDYVIFANYNQVSMAQQFQIKNIGGADRILYTPDVTTTDFNVLAYNNEGNTAYDFTKTFLKYEDGIDAFDQAQNLSYYFDNSGSSLQFSSNAVKSKKLHMAKTYAITADTKTTDTKWLIGDCKDLFWTGDAPFAESEDYRSSKHIALYAAHGTSLEEIESNGVLFTTSKDDAEIDIPMMYGATQLSDALGYYYYDPKTQDPRDVNRYMLFADARPETNIKVNGVAVEGMTLQSQGDYKDEDVVSCVTRHLMYFGPNGESAGTTKFPKGLKIGFFTRYQSNCSRSITPASPGGETGYSYSTAAMNKEHFYVPALSQAYNATYEDNHGFWDYRGSKDGSIGADPSRANVKAITWNYGGRVLVGFGDDTGDCDLNDFVFWVNGDIEEQPKINIEVKDDTDIYEWIVACEDLGSSDDYDFNDVVFGVKHYEKTSTLYESYYLNGELVTTLPSVLEKQNYLVVTPYAAGGSLKSNVYFNSTSLGEIHSLIRNDQKDVYASLASGSMPILNADSYRFKGTPIVIDLGENTFSMASGNMGGFSISTSQEGGAAEGVLIKAPETGTVPQMMVLPNGWDWPTERNRIYNVYPKFENWVATATEYGWIEDPKDSYVTNPYKTTVTPDDDDDDDNGGDDEDTDTRTPMVIGQEYSLTCGSGATHEVHDPWQTWGDKYVFSITSDKKLPSNLPSTATATLTYSWTGGNYYSNADIFDCTYLYLCAATKANPSTSASITLTKEQLTKLLGSTAGFYVVLDNSLTLSSATITINE